mmetsp:Transcript_61921/g.164550  ORF Transcript_61921/g.164550 Transcript_61921/m.164550 type:complete len:2073 (-) Transcript_61921:147-6365(-)
MSRGSVAVLIVASMEIATAEFGRDALRPIVVPRGTVLDDFGGTGWLTSVFSEPVDSECTVSRGKDYWCTVPSGLSNLDYDKIVKKNCDKVNWAYVEFDNVSFSKSWHGRITAALDTCATLDQSLNATERALQAVRAWGVDLMCGRECCNVVGPPFCVSTPSSQVGHVAPLILCLFLVFCSWVFPHTRLGRVLGVRKPMLFFLKDSSPTSSPSFVPEDGPEAVFRNPGKLRKSLEQLWSTSSLSKLQPGRSTLGKVAIDSFVEHTTRFDFQEQSCLNQFEHLISLWRSNCSLVADDQLQGDGDVYNGDLLLDGLDSMHAELLEGFQRWRKKFHCDAEPADEVERIREITAYLLVWGEAGNLRFMAEIICFLTHAVCTSAPTGDFYGGHTPCQSHLFLSCIVRPVYNVVFDAHYFQVTVGGNKRDGKQLLPDYDKFIPSDAPNHDDWNELFNDPAKLEDKLILNDGSKFFMSDPAERFGLLHKVDWTESLRGSKTHRELHSMWGLFASTHRVWFLHILMFALSMFWVSRDDLPDSVLSGGDVWLAGSSQGVALATVGLLVPLHALFWKLSRWIVAGTLRRHWAFKGNCGYAWFALRFCATTCVWALPVFTYIIVRSLEMNGGTDDEMQGALFCHYTVCCIGAGIILFLPAHSEDLVWPLTPTSWGRFAVRYLFWGGVLALKFLVSMNGVRAMYRTTMSLQMATPGHQPVDEIASYAFSPRWDMDMVQWLVMWATAFLLYFTDTQFWAVLGCSLLGIAVAVKQRLKHPRSLIGTEDTYEKIPLRFSRRVLWFDFREEDRIHWAWPNLWDKIVQFMRYEDKIDDEMFKSMVYYRRDTKVRWPALKDVQVTTTNTDAPVLPGLFSESGSVQRLCTRQLGLCTDSNFPQNPEMQWRLAALARALTFDLPRPFRFPYMPGLTVMIPHYGESIYMPWEGDGGLCSKSHTVKLMDWIKHRYGEEYKNFISHQTANGEFSQLPMWSMYGDPSKAMEKEALITWASMRNQTLYRTVAGMTMYHQVLECYRQIRMKTANSVQLPEIQEVFRCMITMQMYRFFSKTEYKHVNRMLMKFPNSLKIAFIDYDDVSDRAGAGRDGIHPRQHRRYYSCIIDGDLPSSAEDDSARKSRYRIELPGYPILGDGKGDNQNHAIIFTRGNFIQMIDANQGAYFEQMLMLPCVLGEFRGHNTVARGARKIVGFPEHITSDVGSIGDFAAGAETAFGTILQRVYCVLGGRMHYGHPDMMNKAYIMQQGGVSKATKTVNLSEDIFAGMDFTLRGGGHIQHTEYFHLVKGRDLGFNAVLGFFSKISSGTGEQILTRQMFRLGQVMGLPEFLMFYYAHAGYYLAQHFMSVGLPMIVYIWLLVLLESGDDDVSDQPQVLAELLSSMFSKIILIFIAAQTLPLVVEIVMQRGILIAFGRVAAQLVTLSPLHFIFQAKIIGNYVSNEIRYGGANYVATGRGLPNERKRFIGWQDEVEFRFYRFVASEAHGRAAQSVKIKDLQFYHGLGKNGDHPVEMPSDAEGILEGELDVGVVVDFGGGKKGKISGYSFKTSTDSTFYDPMRWRLEGSNDEKQMKWNVVHSGECILPSARNTQASVFPVLKGAKVGKGGLYNDYASHAHHDGARLLVAVIIVFCVGGLDIDDKESLSWLGLVLALTIVSWLYTPYIFNPYQFAFDEWWDFRHWREFFFKENGRQWFEWYQDMQLKPMSGLRSTPGNVLLNLLFLGSWWVVINRKTHDLSVYMNMRAFEFIMFLPPVLLNFCVVLPSVAWFWPGGYCGNCLGHSGGHFCGRRPTGANTSPSLSFRYWRFLPTKLRQGDETHVRIGEFVVYHQGSEVKAKSYEGSEFTLKEARDNGVFNIEFEAPTLIDSYSYATSIDQPQRDPINWKLEGSNNKDGWVTVHEQKNDFLTPQGFRGDRLEPQSWHAFAPRGLLVAMVIIIFADFFEIFGLLLIPVVVVQTDGFKTVVVGAIFKYVFLSILIQCVECVFCLRGRVPQFGCLRHNFLRIKEGLKLWLCAHRIAADIAVSFLIMAPLTIFVVVDWILRTLCKCRGFSIHQLLVFRDPGQVATQTLQVPVAPMPGP